MQYSSRKQHKAHLHGIEKQRWVVIQFVVLESFESISWAGPVLNTPETLNFIFKTKSLFSLDGNT